MQKQSTLSMLCKKKKIHSIKNKSRSSHFMSKQHAKFIPDSPCKLSSRLEESVTSQVCRTELVSATLVPPECSLVSCSTNRKWESDLVTFAKTAKGVVMQQSTVDMHHIYKLDTKHINMPFKPGQTQQRNTSGCHSISPLTLLNSHLKYTHKKIITKNTPGQSTVQKTQSCNKHHPFKNNVIWTYIFKH